MIGALIPSAGLLFLFWLALRALIQADRRERAAEAKWNREHGIVPATPQVAVEVPTGSAEAPATGDNGHSVTAAPTAEPASGERPPAAE